MSNEHPVIHSFAGIADLLAYVSARPTTLDLPVRVHGFYMAFRPNNGPAQFGVLLSRAEQVKDVERVNCIPAKIDFGVTAATRVQGIAGISEPRIPPPDRSWTTVEGLLSWWNTPDRPLFCRLNVGRTV